MTPTPIEPNINVVIIGFLFEEKSFLGQLEENTIPDYHICTHVMCVQYVIFIFSKYLQKKKKKN